MRRAWKSTHASAGSLGLPWAQGTLWPGMAAREHLQDAIRLVVAGHDHQAVADEIGVSKRTVRRWSREPAFQAALTTAREQLLNQVVEQLKVGALRAVAEIQNALGDENPQIRLRAADRLLSHTLRAVELVEHEQRLRTLEERVAQDAESPWAA